MLVIKERSLKRRAQVLNMLATLIVCRRLIRLGGGLRSAHTHSCEGGTSLLHRKAYRHESGVTAEQELEGTDCASCALYLAL